MTKRYNSPSGVALHGVALLAVMLFYVSGAARLVHIELDHAHGPAGTQNVCDDAHGSAENNAPADAPKTPTKTHCRLCDMLAGSTHMVAVAAPGQPIFPGDAHAYLLTPAESPAERLSAPDISRRGPPSLG